jgi:type I restriction enzyme S subunit
MKYVRVPNELTTQEVLSEDHCFSPGRYVRFIPPKEKGLSHFVPLDELVHVRDETVKVDKACSYKYAEIGDIDVATGGVSFREMRGHQLPTQRPARAAAGDVLVSTVRTYRKGIGLVTDDDADLVTTGAILNLCSTKSATGVALPYIYSFLRSDFFVEQVWSLLHRGVYPRMDKGALSRILVPVTESAEASSYVAALAQSIADKERAIRSKSSEIHAAIDLELAIGQGNELFKYAYPNLDELRKTLRFDTGLYCKGFREFQHRVTNYRHGTTTLSSMGVRSRRGPNLAVSVIGKSLYGNVRKAGWYELIRPVNISEFGTVSSKEWLGTSKKLPTLSAGDLILGCEGFEKGRSIVLIEAPERCTTNFHGTVLSWPGAEIWRMVFVRCFLAYLRANGVIDWVGVGGSGGHMSPSYFDYLPFPRVPDTVQIRISRLYHNPVPAPKGKLTVDNFVGWHREWNRGLGIWELDREMRALQDELERAQTEIIEGRSPTIPNS